jgi:hypothetical protein
MTLSTEEATTWVKDVVLDCDEIWKAAPELRVPPT